MDFSKLRKKYPVPVLIRANQRQWFEIIEIYFKEEKLGYVLCQTKMEYAFIQLGFGSGSYTLMTDNKNNLLNTGCVQNVEKKAEYYATVTKVQYMLIICINDFDAKFIREFDLIKKKQDEL